MKTAIKCTEFVDVLGTEQVYSIVALAAFQSKDFVRCRWALIKLKTLSEGGDKLSLELKKLRPIDKKNLGSAYTQIGNGKKLQAYTISGRQIVNEQSIQC